MNGCRACFRSGGPTELTDEPGMLGNCEFCGRSATRVWDVSIWSDHFARVLDMYDESTAEEARPITRALQEDWKVFTFEDAAKQLQFLQAALPSHPLLDPGICAQPRYGDAGPVADHATSWAKYCEELISVNRFFPAATIDFEFFAAIVTANLRQIDSGLTLYRARPTDDPHPYPDDRMGAPPAHLAKGGRANPQGISHLYLASDLSTSLAESRATVHGYVCIASFRLLHDVTVLDLVDIEIQNPFLIDVDEEGNALLRNLVSSRFLRELGRELSIPARPGVNQVEYIPTQYLCEFVKSLGVRGIRYGSAMNPGGWNVVLFDAADAELVPPVTLHEITGMSLAAQPVPVGEAMPTGTPSNFKGETPP